MTKKTTESLIKDLKSIYGDKFDYSKTVYYGSNKNFTLVCPKHGEISVRYDHIIDGSGCPQCKKEAERDKRWNEYIKRAKEIHGEKYLYDKSNFANIESSIKIICPNHGEFYQTLNNHINQKQGCPKCYHESRLGKYKISTEEFITLSKLVHGNKYDYSKTVYHGQKEKTNIKCPIHGEFQQVAYDHLKGFGCQKCKIEKQTNTKEDFIKKAREIHGWKYDYSKVEYINNKIKVCIICPEHGEFWQSPLDHLLGSGCKYCNMSHLERSLINLFKKENIEYIFQVKQETLPWLKRQSLDFYLPNYNIGIECQGKQHFKECDFFGGKEQFKKQIERDKRKKKLCEDNNVKLLYFSKENNTTYKCISDENELLKIIRGLV